MKSQIAKRENCKIAKIARLKSNKSVFKCFLRSLKTKYGGIYAKSNLLILLWWGYVWYNQMLKMIYFSSNYKIVV